jgi:sulfane dehydrogenase subunit SoxC
MTRLVGRRGALGLMVGGAVAPSASSSANSDPRDTRAPTDPTRTLGDPISAGYGQRSAFETTARALVDGANPWAGASFTPLGELVGNITPSGLHFERHHAGVPIIDPARHMLFVHGNVAIPKKFTMADLRRFPSVTRRLFIECSGNSSSEWRGPTGKSVQFTHGLLSTSEWTGVPFSAVARDAGLAEGEGWVLAEGSDAAVMTRSLPLEKLLSDGLLAYGQNGEALRPEQGYPLRLIVPGYEGNVHIKWLRRLEVADRPFMTREETSRYTDLMADGKARMFTFLMDAKSVITSPSAGMKLTGPGAVIISGLAWTGRGGGLVRRVEISVDGGTSWRVAPLDSPPEPFSTVRFSLPWRWDGRSAVLQSRCIDETGYLQPSRAALIAERPANGPLMSIYHFNAIQSWAVAPDGNVTNAPA